MRGWFHDLSIRRKLALLILVIGGIAVVLASAGLLLLISVDIRKQTVSEIFTLAEAVGSNSTAALTFQDRHAAEETLAALRADKRIVQAAVFNKDKSLFAQYAQPGPPRPTPALRPPGDYFENGVFLLVRPILLNGERIGTILVRCSMDSAMTHMLRSIAMMVLVISLSFVAALLFSTRLQRGISDPLLYLAETARQVSAGKSYSIRAVAHGNDEIGVLIRAFNDMLAQIQVRDLELGHHRERLELQVAVRTQELTDANRDLAAATVKAQSLARMKSEFLANMSHEIRTPMNGIIGMTELALETNLTREQKECITMVKTSADALLTVINDILDFSKMEAGKLALLPAPFELRQLLRDTLKTLSLGAGQKGLELTCDVAPDAPDYLVGDAARLRQVLLNLLGNAIKFTERGDVALSVEADWISEHKAGLRFQVRDTGIGVPKDKQDYIFEMFAQVDGSTTRRYGGTGLGLAISQQLLKLMGGRLLLESEPDKGSTFHFTIELELAPEGVATRPPADLATLRGISVLVVDDNEVNRRILERLLERWQMRAVAVDSGAAALAAISQAHQSGTTFRLVLLDAHMPKMDGFELARRIHEMPELEGVIVMMLSSAHHMEDADKCRAAGIRRYLVKPIFQNELLQAILHAAADLEGISEAVPLKAPPPVQQPHGPSLRILLAEDNPVNQRVAVKVLEKYGHTVTVAGNGREAVALALRQAFDLILMDIQMPEMDGYEATGAIREAEGASGAHTPIVALTAHANKSDQDRCLAAGMDDYISKPIHVEDLLQKVERFAPKTTAS
jgi:signal transduction histidine kinase/CheY-like chemotaxis protein